MTDIFFDTVVTFGFWCVITASMTLAIALMM
jgi:hypothetical protein